MKIKRNIITFFPLAVLYLFGCQVAPSAERTEIITGQVDGQIIAAEYTNIYRPGPGAIMAFPDVAGNALGRRPNASDGIAAEGGFIQATRVPIGETVYWDNHRTGHFGTYCPIRDGHSACGDYCREFTTTIYVNGFPERSVGTACRRPNGTWELI